MKRREAGQLSTDGHEGGREEMGVGGWRVGSYAVQVMMEGGGLALARHMSTASERPTYQLLS